jgi:hypothetical protein
MLSSPSINVVENNENIIPPEQQTYNKNNKSNQEAHKLANDLVSKAKALSSSVKKMPPSSPLEDARRGFNLKHLNVLATRFAQLAEISTALEDENLDLKNKLSSSKKEYEIMYSENVDLGQKVKTVQNTLLPKMKMMRRKIVELKRENVYMNEALEEVLSQSEILTKRTKQGEIIVVKLQNVCKRLVEELNKTKLELLEAKTIASAPIALGTGTITPQQHASSPMIHTPGSVRPLEGTPQALYDGGFRDMSHFQQYVAKMEERRVALEEERLKAKAIRHSKNNDGNGVVPDDDNEHKKVSSSSLKQIHTIPSPSSHDNNNYNNIKHDNDEIQSPDVGTTNIRRSKGQAYLIGTLNKQPPLMKSCGTSTPSEKNLSPSKNIGISTVKKETTNSGTNPQVKSTHNASTETVQKMTVTSGGSISPATHSIGTETASIGTKTVGTETVAASTNTVGTETVAKTTISQGVTTTQIETCSKGTATEEKSIVASSTNTIQIKQRTQGTLTETHANSNSISSSSRNESKVGSSKTDTEALTTNVAPRESRDACTTTMKRITKSSGTNPDKPRTVNSGTNPARAKTSTSSTSTKTLLKKSNVGIQSGVIKTKTTGTNPNKANLQNTGTNPTVKDTNSTATQKNLPRKEITSSGTNPDRKATMSASTSTEKAPKMVTTGINTTNKKMESSATSTDTPKKKHFSSKEKKLTNTGTNPAVRRMATTGTNPDAKRMASTGTNPNVKNTISSGTQSLATTVQTTGTNPEQKVLVSSGTLTDNKQQVTEALSSIDTTVDTDNNKNVLNENQLREILKSYDHDFRINVIKKTGKSKWKALTFKERVHIMEEELKNHSNAITKKNHEKKQRSTNKRLPPFVSATRRNTVIGEDKGAISTKIKPYMGNSNSNNIVDNHVTTSSMSIQVSPKKPETVSLGTSMEDLEQFHRVSKDAELLEQEEALKKRHDEQERKLKQEQAEQLDQYQKELEKKIRDMTEKFAAQIADAARLSGDEDTDFNYGETDLDIMHDV